MKRRAQHPAGRRRLLPPPPAAVPATPRGRTAAVRTVSRWMQSAYTNMHIEELKKKKNTLCVFLLVLTMFNPAAILVVFKFTWWDGSVMWMSHHKALDGTFQSVSLFSWCLFWRYLCWVVVFVCGVPSNNNLEENSKTPVKWKNQQRTLITDLTIMYVVSLILKEVQLEKITSSKALKHQKV